MLTSSERQQSYRYWLRRLRRNPKLAELAEPRANLYTSRRTPTDLQAAGLVLMNRELFFGGAAGPGKTEFLLLASLQFADVEDYSAILFRRTYPQLEQPRGLIPRSHELLAGTGAVWKSREHRWYFPARGTSLTLAHLQHDADVYDHQGAEYDFIGFDELTHFSRFQYRYMFSRLRRRTGSVIPPRMRGTGNPGGKYHEWVKRRFIDESAKQAALGLSKRRVTLRGVLADNPHADPNYVESLSYLDSITRRQLLEGDWTARTSGGMFKREWFPVVDELPADCRRAVRYWDLAATPKKGGAHDPSWTAGLLMTRHPGNGRFFVVNVRRRQATPGDVEALVKQTAALDAERFKKGVEIWMEQEPGSGGVNTIAHYRNLLAGFVFRPDKKATPKDVRAQPLSSMAEANNISLVRGPWNEDLLDELEAFPEGDHDDQVDAMSGAFEKISGRAQNQIRWLDRSSALPQRGT